MKLKILFAGLVLMAGTFVSRAEEGMWIPMLIEKYNIETMQAAGLKLSAEQIYSINEDCLKDALVIFGRGCTGEMVSSEGLLLTNHHCGYGAIQQHSSVETDYLTDGFWAMSRDEELPNEGLTVTYLRYIEDVSEAVMEGTSGEMGVMEQEQVIRQNIKKISSEATSDTHYHARVTPMYYGNAYYLFVYETFTDVRLVGAPPSSIGNFGEDQDNWMWPRHTGDFSVFRVYANADNEPAGFDVANKPYKPRRHLEIAAGGVEEGEYTMVMGYPGSTEQYLYSAAVKHMLDNGLPVKISLRTTRLEIMDKYMKESDVVRIQYATKYRRVSNAWKKWQGIILGLSRNDAVERKIEEEEVFTAWLGEDAARLEKYGSVLENFAALYTDMADYELAMDMLYESVMVVELFKQARSIKRSMSAAASPEELEASMKHFAKDYYMPVDRDIFAAMMEAYDREMPVALKPAFFEDIHGKYKGDFAAYADYVYGKTVFNTEEKLMKLFARYDKKAESTLEKLDKDPLMLCMNQFLELYRRDVLPKASELEAGLELNYKLYMAALMEQAGDRMLFPDANFTLRFTFGKVDAYKPKDAVEYSYYTTLSGVMDKSGEEFEDYRIPDRLRELYDTKDFGPYGVDGTMPVCFIASNHTSGGNSGSPVMDAEGRLIGINFDRNWEGTMSDVYYDPSLCRNISVDIRYVLFIIDKFAGASYLLDEMDIVFE